MLQSEVQTAARSTRLEYLGYAALQALTAGASPTELMATISTTIDDYQARQPALPGLLPCDDGKERIFDECPDGLIDLPSAANEYGINKRRLQRWIENGHIQAKGRIRASAPGGGVWLVSHTDIKQLLKCPPKNGRPSKS